MTQVPPTRYSSAIITFAPCSAATLAARTPPDPAPITKRSTSVIQAPSRIGRRSEIVALLLHLGAHPAHHLFGELVGPLLDAAETVVEEFRLLIDDLAAQRRLVEGERVLELLLGEGLR